MFFKAGCQDFYHAGIMKTSPKKKAFVFDLDSTISHATTIPDGLNINGRVSNAVIDKRTLALLKDISRFLDLFVATGRSSDTVVDFKTHFLQAGVEITGWILEHGTIVEGYPEWTENVLQGIDLSTIHAEAQTIVKAHKLPVDTECYKKNHKGFLLYSGRDKFSSEYFLSKMSGFLENKFRTSVGKRKISIIPKKGDKYLAFNHNFGDDYLIAFAAGDAPDDLTLLQYASFPLSISGSSLLVQNYIHKRGGYVSDEKNHSGVIEILELILYHLKNNLTKLAVPGPRLPFEEIEIFRKSRCVFLNHLFHIAKYPRVKPDIYAVNQLSKNLALGKETLIEIRMRDWGGEVKPLRNLLKVMVSLLPYARYRLIFRQERLGIENLKNFKAISDKLADFVKLPNKLPRFSAPGVPDSPHFKSEPSLILFLYDHPDDIAPWYDYTISRLITRHPKTENTFYINPMFLKIADMFNQCNVFSKMPPLITMCGPRVMMAANIVDQRDIQIAIEGFQQLSPYLDALIIAPRVVTNVDRNRMIRDAVECLGEDLVFYSRLKSGENPKFLFVDTYGDLNKLYNSCALTYLGGGYDTRKRGFDPVESLLAGVPVVLGPIFDFNRIAVDSLKDSGWITVLTKESTVREFVSIAKERILLKPECAVLEKFFLERQQDPLRVAVTLLKTLYKNHHVTSGPDN
ncbi:hypothetical protein JWG39_00465 [Desulforhopalus vacuolatus]|uniref:hypothetical protein n=1 Tax=Desulforhopalus vacuolatus TaxID=40414 RepID=UPI001962BF5E|nr:hypothetical protein [Desulforhopalus vacuolatus]MBM9518287.1 hypothetical protein [Desulforhopalus vacuolatus]